MIENKEEIRRKIIEIFDELALIDETNVIEIDSLQFMHVIVELEQKFDIEIPYEYLSMDKLKTIDDYTKTVEECEKKMIKEN